MCYRTTVVLIVFNVLQNYDCFNCVTVRSTVLQPDILEIQNYIENNYQYDTKVLLGKHKTLP